MTLTADWTDTDIDSLVAFCVGLRIDDVSVPLRVWANESDNRATAHNPNGDASGIFQLMPATARGLGWPVDQDPHLDRFCQSTVTGQLSYAAKYYGPHRGSVGTVARLYLCTFMPALLSHGDDMGFVICGNRPGDPYSWAYLGNKGFDVERKGFITPQDLVNAAARATGPRTLELIARAEAAKADTAGPEDPEAA